MQDPKTSEDEGSRGAPSLWGDVFTTWTVVGFVTLIGVVLWTVWIYLFGF